MRTEQEKAAAIMKIICAGMNKTGTKSVTKALRHLGYTVFDWEEQVFDFIDHWVDVFQNGAEPDVRRVYQNADAVVDFPGHFFWEEILEAFPDCKVILSEREEDSWIKSVVNQFETVESAKSRKLLMLSPTGRKLFSILYGYRAALFGFCNSTKSTCVFRKRYRIHNHRVKSMVPPEKLLVYNVQQGWKPLCDFLGCDIPTVAFPRENIKGEIAKVPLTRTRIGRQIKREIHRFLFVVISVVFVLVSAATFLYNASR